MKEEKEEKKEEKESSFLQSNSNSNSISLETNNKQKSMSERYIEIENNYQIIKNRLDRLWNKIS
jgi:hypothetical protein